jgi:glycosyltransferase involved in cell wall biosynthesis
MNAAAPATIAVVSTVHVTHDTRIYYKQIGSLRRHFSVTYYSPMAVGASEDGVVPLFKGHSKFGRLRTHLSLWRQLARRRADLYLFHDPELLPLAVLLSLFGKKVVWDMHEDTYNDIKTKIYLPRLVRGTIAGIFRAFQSLAHGTLSGLVLAEDDYGRYFPGSKKTCVVHNYPMLERLADVRDIPKRPNSLVYIGSISEHRGVFQLLALVARLKPAIPDVHLTLIGPFVSTELEARVRARVAELGIGPAIDITGPIRNVESYPVVARAQVGLALLLPEKNFVTSLPTKMFEYMALGLPVMVSNFPLWRGIVESHDAGSAVDPCDIEVAARTAGSMLTDPARYAQLSVNARSAARNYSWESEAARLRDFLAGILAA